MDQKRKTQIERKERELTAFQRERIAAENRKRFPEIAEFVDEVRKYFPGAEVTYAGAPRESTTAILRSAAVRRGDNEVG